MAKTEVKKGVSESELRASFAGPAIHSNKMYVTTVQSGVRIAFMEQAGDIVEPTFRSAVMLSFHDAIALRNILVRMLAPIEGAIEGAQVVPPTGTED